MPHLDRQQLMQQLGGFWCRRLPTAGLLAALADAQSLAFQPTLDGAADLSESTYVEQANRPTYTRRMYICVPADELKGAYHKIGEGTIGTGAIGERAGYQLDIDQDIQYVHFVQQTIDGQSAVLLPSTDYAVVPGGLRLFSLDGLTLSVVNGIPCYEFWLIGAERAPKLFSRRWGAVLPLATPGGWYVTLDGSDDMNVRRLLAEATDSVLCLEDQAVIARNDRSVATTSQIIPAACAPAAEVGDILFAGTICGDADFAPLISWPNWLAGVELDANLQSVGGAFRLPNTETTLTVSGTAVSWAGTSSEWATIVNEYDFAYRVLGNPQTGSQANVAKTFLSPMAGTGQCILIKNWESHASAVYDALQHLQDVFPRHVMVVVVLDGDNDNYGRTVSTTLRRLKEHMNEQLA